LVIGFDIKPEYAMNPLAEKLNSVLPAPILDALSKKGRTAFFPSAGILGQAAQARGRQINATIGIALEEDGAPMRLQGLDALFQIDGREAFPYAPSFGKPGLRDRWQSMLREKNPSLGKTALSRPVVTGALTHGLSVAGAMFLDPGESLIVPDLFWGNYRLIFEHAHGARLDTYPLFDEGGFNVAGLRARLFAEPPGKRVVLLNFPNNPTGYTCSPAEAKAICGVLVEAADAGCEVVALIDDAYFGLVYEDGVIEESIFTQLATAHERLLAVKIDGATKEDYAWGFRVGFITYASSSADETVLDALAQKTAGVVRGSISNASHLSQSLLLAAYDAPDYGAWKAEKYAVLAGRYHRMREVLAAHPEYAERFQPLPCNSGYFMCVRPLAGEAEAIRRHLLSKYDTGLIATAGLLRIAFSSVPTASIADLFANLYAAIGDVTD